MRRSLQSTMVLIQKAVLFLFVVYCVALSEGRFQDFLGSRTPYRQVGNKNDSRIEYPGCSPQKIWMINRHGTRNAGKDFIKVMKKRLSTLRDLILNAESELSASELELFEQWTVKLHKKDDQLLTEEGANELRTIANRMQKRFPTILSPIYGNSSYQFRYTDTSRTMNSARNFSASLFGEEQASRVWYQEPISKDPILKFEKLCDEWNDNVDKNPDAYKEKKKFKTGEIARKSVIAVTRKLGLNDDELSFNDLHHMYKACGFETAWSSKIDSPWCTVFEKDTLKAVEYYDDLDYYWKDGYGHRINYKQACPAFVDMYEFITNSPPDHKATHYFTHSGTLLKIQAHFGLHKDIHPLLHDKIDDSRKWRVSKIDSFATNVAIVSYMCLDGIKLLLLNQEHITRFPCCPNTDLCELETIETFYGDSIECKFNEMCNNNQDL